MPAHESPGSLKLIFVQKLLPAIKVIKGMGIIGLLADFIPGKPLIQQAFDLVDQCKHSSYMNRRVVVYYSTS
jgi:hypothetical protein